MPRLKKKLFLRLTWSFFDLIWKILWTKFWFKINCSTGKIELNEYPNFNRYCSLYTSNVFLKLYLRQILRSFTLDPSFNLDASLAFWNPSSTLSEIKCASFSSVCFLYCIDWNSSSSDGAGGFTIFRKSVEDKLSFDILLFSPQKFPVFFLLL